MDTAFFESSTYLYIVLPLLIFTARIIDVTLGTMRIIFVSKGQRMIAPILGFFEILIWIMAISQIMSNLNNFVCYFAYAAGFATGNWVGMRLEEHLAMGNLIIRMIVAKDVSHLVKNLNEKGYGTTTVHGEGSQGNVHLIYCIVKRSDLPEVTSIIEQFDPKIFFSIEDTRKVSAGIFPSRSPIRNINPLKRWRTGK